MAGLRSTSLKPSEWQVAKGIQYITDSSWSTGIANLGREGVPLGTANGGILAGTFGGQTYFGSTNGIILIGVGSESPAWGSWTIRLILSNDNYSSPISFTDSNLVKNPAFLAACGVEATFISPARLTGAAGRAERLAWVLLGKTLLACE